MIRFKCPNCGNISFFSATKNKIVWCDKCGSLMKPSTQYKLPYKKDRAFYDDYLNSREFRNYRS